MPDLSFFKKEFDSFLEQEIVIKEPRNLYEPMLYIMQLGGKRLRPVLTLLATDLLGGDFKKALSAALAIEVFHNFSLVHDDIMDEAPLRRGKKSVHKKWDINTGILSGDAMLIAAYKLLEFYEDSQYKELLSLFNDTALKVCEGQQYDIDFETRDDVTLEEYLHMISFKTAILIAAALKMGGVIANSSEMSQQALFDYGMNLGIAFQIQDDYLDAFGDASKFGKQIGGDIIENKKTYLYLKAEELADPEMKKELNHLYSLSPRKPEAKIRVVKEIFEKTGAVEETKTAISDYTDRALSQLAELESYNGASEALKDFATKLMRRDA